jgi:AraC-like DNA-binding protein
MKALTFKIPNNEDDSFRVQNDILPYYYDKLHQHHEIQITYIIKGSGTLMLEDYIGEFYPGNVYVIGSYVSHVFRSEAYHNDREDNVHCISLFFDPDFLGHSFLNLPELHQFNDFIKKSFKGLEINQPVASTISVLMYELNQKKDFERLIIMLKILSILSDSDNYKVLSKAVPVESLSNNTDKRLNEIFNFTIKQYAEEIKLQQIAGMANMTVSAFCKFFKLHTGKTYFQFLNEIRISNACKLLREDKKSIEHIACDTGFKNLSNFNRKFKQINGVTPSEFRRKYFF